MRAARPRPPSGRTTILGGMSEDIVGRDTELASMRAFLDRAPAGPAALVVEGQPGIGKTTLWLAGVQEARDRGYRVLSSRPAESEATLSFTVLGDLLEKSLPEALESLPPPQRRALEAALLLAEPSRRHPDRRTVLVAVLGVVRALAGTGPVLIAVDDVQWLDRPSSAALEFAIRRLTTEPVALLLAVRRDAEALPFGLDEPPLEERVTRLSVAGLSFTEINELVRRKLAVGFPRSTVEQLHTASGGNPFFALEMARTLTEGRRAPRPGEPLLLPDNLRDLLRERIAGLPQTTRDVLLTIATLARPSEPQLEAVHGARAVRVALERATQAGLIEAPPGDVRFSHPLLGSAVYSEASAEQRRKTHERLAALTSDREERARHLALAASGPDADVAGALEEAAHAALERGAPVTAADLFHMASGLTPPERSDDARRRLREAGQAHWAAGDAPTARALLDEVVRTAPSGREQAEALYQLGMVEADESGWPVAAETFQKGLRHAADHPPLLRSLEQGLGYASLFMGDLLRSEAHGQRALEIAEALDDPVGLAESLSALAFVRFVLGSGLPSPLMDRALGVFDGIEPTSLFVVLRPPFAHAQMLKYADRLEESRTVFDDLLRRAADEGHEQAFPVLHFHLAELEVRAGDWAAAAQHAEESLKLAALAQMRFNETMARYAVALVRAHHGEEESAREHAEAGLALAETSRVTLSAILNLGVLGFLEVSLRNEAAAHEHLERATGLISSMGVGEPGYLRIVPDAVEACVAVGKLERAEALLKPFMERARALDRSSALAAAGRCAGLLAAARGDSARALRALRRALREHERARQPFERARTLLVLGQVLRRGRQKRAARETLELARDMFQDLDARLWTVRAEEELRRVGGRAPAPLALTPTEERVAELAAAGRTNREIADALFMSVHTVEWNLSKIYRKLGIRSRTELAAGLAGRSGGS